MNHIPRPLNTDGLSDAVIFINPLDVFDLISRSTIIVRVVLEFNFVLRYILLP